jgi:hypothetical protein
VIPVPVELPVAVRAHTTREQPRKGTPRPREAPSGAVLVFDTETTIDEVQALTFGSWRYYRPDGRGVLECVDEGLFYADDLPNRDPTGYAVLCRHSRRVTSAATGQPGVRLLSRAEFVNRVFYPAAWESRATVVGFNLPFDISRLAIGVSEGRGRNLRGFSFYLAAGNAAKGYKERRHVPRVLVKHVNSHAAFIHFGKAYQAAVGWDGDFVDLRTLTFALTAAGHSLASGCAAFGLPGKADPGGHGVITPEYVDYCRTDVEATFRLYQRCVVELAALDMPITASRAFSPASLAKAALAAQGIVPHRQRPTEIPAEVQGYFMSAFYGGRAECRIRHTEVPVSLLDFLSMYPTLFALMDIHRYSIAEQVGHEDATDDVRALLADVTLDGTFDPALWPELVGVALVEPDADILPVRARYDDRKPSWNIGVNYLTSSTPLWYTIPDLIASTLLTGKPPKVLRAIRLTSKGRLPGLRPWTMPGGRVIDPHVDACWPAMIQHRQALLADEALPAEVVKRIRMFLKITSNAGGYGIYAEHNRQDLPKGQRAEVTVYSAEDPFVAEVGAPEDPGRYACPPLAAVITSGARLMVAILERCVIDAGGAWAFADTDSMAVVSTPLGGLVPCEGGDHRDEAGRDCVRALTAGQVAAIRERFSALSPYHRDVVAGSILKHELDAYCYAVAAKRYALYRYDEEGRPRLVPADEHEPCSHGLGHLLNPTDPGSDDRDWIVQLWERELALRLGICLGDRPEWYERVALGRVAITAPATWEALRRYNHGKEYRNQIKPFGFLLHAPGADTSSDEAAGRLVAPFERDRKRWDKLGWIDLAHPEDRIKISADPARPSRALVDSYGVIASTYFSHREAKSSGPDGQPADRSSRGQLCRRHVQLHDLTITGKEANDIEDRIAGMAEDPHVSPAVLVHQRPADHVPDDSSLQRLRAIGAARLATMTGRSARRIADILYRGVRPHARTTIILEEALVRQSTNVGPDQDPP